jgi:hypothetical protein
MNFGNISNFGEKIENFPKIKIHRNFSAANSFEKIHKISKIIFFSKFYDFLSTKFFSMRLIHTLRDSPKHYFLKKFDRSTEICANFFATKKEHFFDKKFKTKKSCF